MNNMQKSPLQKAVERAHALGRRAVIPFITAGFPDKESFWTHLSRIDEAGADIIEIGVPFSDPVADGPVIEQASRDACSITGPSATGSEKGTPISIISAPASSIRDKCVQKDSLSGNPAVMKGITARLPRAWALSTAFCNGDFCILFMEECGLKIQIFFNDSQVLVSAAGEIDQNVPPLRQFLRMVQHPGHGMGGFQRRNDSFLPGERLESV